MGIGKDRADKLKHKEAITQSKRERQLQKAPLLKAKAAALWEALIARLLIEVTDFNTSLQDHPEHKLQMDSGSAAVEIRRSKYPQQRLSAYLEVAAERIAIQRVTTPAPGEGSRYELNETLQLSLDDDNELYVRRHSQVMQIDAIIELLLGLVTE